MSYNDPLIPVNLFRLHTFSRLFSRGYFVSLNVCLVVMGVLRPVYLLADPYNLGGLWPRGVAYLLLDTGFPCVTTAFAVLFLALLRATQVRIYCMNMLPKILYTVNTLWHPN